MRFVILHYHILKNAGSTIEEILEHSFHERLARIDHPDRDGIIPASDVLALVESNPRLRAVTSHSIRYPMPDAPGILFFDICFLRDPLDRVRSMYDYFRKRPADGDPVSHLANSTSIGEFIAEVVERYPLQVRNVQVNLVAAAGDSDEPTQQDLERATTRMQEASFLGVVDRFDESIRAGAYFLKAVFPSLDCAIPPVNVSKGLDGTVESRTEQLRQACAPDVFEQLIRITALDSELLSRARAEVRRRLQLVPADPYPPRKARPTTTATRALLSPSLFKTLRHLPSLLRTPLNPHPLFDAAFYLQRYPDVAASGFNPLAHYLARGAKEGRQPHPMFDPAFYLAMNPDVAAAGANPLEHYVLSGCIEGRKPHRLFQPDYYLEQCPEAGRGNGNPLAHFVGTASGGASPHRLYPPGPIADPIVVPAEGDIVIDDAPLCVSDARFLQSLNKGQLRRLRGRAQ